MSRPHNTKTAGILWIVILISVAVFLYFRLSIPKITTDHAFDKRSITIAEKTYTVYEAKTPIQKEIGLSLFDSIKDNEGMLFYFDTLGKPVFWMKDMKFPIDIVWLKDWTVVQIDQNIPLDRAKTDDQLRDYIPANDINAVLELNAGGAMRGNIKIGDVLQLN